MTLSPVARRASLVLILLFPMVSVASDADSTLVLMPVDYTRYEISAGGVADALPEATEVARENLRRELDRLLGERPGLVVANKVDDLDSMDADFIEHLELVRHIVMSSGRTLGSWPGLDPSSRPDFYTVGPGLAGYREAVRGDKLLIIGGASYEATKGRVFTAFALAYATGYSIPVGGGSVHAVVVDLKTGNIEWANQVINESYHTDPSRAEGAQLVIERLFDKYPESKFSSK